MKRFVDLAVIVTAICTVALVVLSAIH